MIRLSVKVIPGAKKSAVEVLPDGSLKVRVTAPAESGRANMAVIKALAEHFDVPKRAVTIVRGASSRQKLIEIA